MLDGIVFIAERQTRGRGKTLAEIAGRIVRRKDGNYLLSCSFSKDAAVPFVDPTKQKGLLPGIKGGTGYLVFTKNGYILTSGGKGSTRRAFQCVLRVTPVNKEFLEIHENKEFEGIKVDNETVLLTFKE